MENGKRSRRGACRYQWIKMMNEQRHAWLVMKYQFYTGVKVSDSYLSDKKRAGIPQLLSHEVGGIK